MATKKNDDDLGQAEVQETVDAEQEQGYRGVSTKAFDRDAYSLASGPDAPSPLEEHEASLRRRADRLAESAK